MAWVCSDAHRRARAALLCVALVALQPVVAAPSVSLAGVSGDKALLVVGNAPPRFVAVGQTHQGARLLAVDGQQATVDFEGQKLILRMGESALSVGSNGSAVASGGGRVVLAANGQGHYLTTGSVNGQSVHFVVDTGATLVTLGRSDALRMGIKVGVGSGKKTRTLTANGVSEAWETQLDSVRVGSVEVPRVTALIMPHDMPVALLGNSFLKHFKMQSDNQQMVLERRP